MTRPIERMLAILMFTLSAQAMADQYVQGYQRRDGTYVDGYHRSTPNSQRWDNYGTQGNTNPYTGQRGYEPIYPPPRYDLGNPHQQPQQPRQRYGW